MKQSHKSLYEIATAAKKTGGLAMTTLLVSLILGCKVEPLKPPLVQTVAILLFDNEANYLNAPEIMQSLVIRALKSSPYQMLDQTLVRDKLNAAGITDGGQLAAVDPVKLGKDLGVQGLMYGSVTHFNYVNVGFYVQKKVGLDLKLVDVQTGQTLWENSGVAANTKLTLDAQEAGQNFAGGVADQYLEKLMKIPLHEEAKLATIKALQTLVGFRFNGFAAPDDKSEALKEVTHEIITPAKRRK